MKILICGDSFAQTDPRYPNLHWSEKILEFSEHYEVINMSYGGCTNALISLQLSQGLKFNPDFVIFTFTSVDRFEYDNDIKALPRSMQHWDIADYLKKRWITSAYESTLSKQKASVKYMLEHGSKDFERLKNYFHIMYCLNEAHAHGIPFCFSLGGFEYQHDYTHLLNQNCLANSLAKYSDTELSTNLWYYQSESSLSFFHVDDENVQNLFASECIDHISKISKTIRSPDRNDAN